jgi:hypothetical protein
MPQKMIVMVKRKPGLTPEQFRDGYENSHSRIAVELFGHLWAEYRRNYIGRGQAFAAPRESGPDGPDEIGFDAVSEYVFKEGKGVEDMAAISALHMDRILEDQAKWFHEKRCWSVTCETMEEDLSGR